MKHQTFGLINQPIRYKPQTVDKYMTILRRCHGCGATGTSSWVVPTTSSPVYYGAFFFMSSEDLFVSVRLLLLILS